MNILRRIWLRPPVAFPLILLYHVVMLCWMVYDVIVEQLSGGILFQPFSMALYTIAWFLVTYNLKRWTGYLYLGLTTLNLAARFLITNPLDRAYYIDVLFPADIIFTFVILLYIKKFD